MRKLLMAVALVGITIPLVVACGATPTPEVIKEVVRETVLVQEVVTRLVVKEVTRIVTPTLTKAPVAVPTPTGIPTTAASPTVDLTAAWETYAGDEYSFRYPKGLKSDTGAAGADRESIRVQFMGPKQIASGRTQTELADGYAFIVTKIGSASEKSASDWALEARAQTKEWCNFEGSKVSEVGEVTVDGQAGFQFTDEGCYGDHTTTFVADEGRVYRITQFYTGEDDDVPEYKGLTELILSTLKFSR